MVINATARRRWIGALALLVALGLLVCGQTVLEGKLGGLGFMLYWLACFGFTGLAVLIALLDARSLQRRVREEQRDLFQHTLTEIETEAKARSRQRDRGRRRH